MYEGPATIELPVSLHQLPTLCRSGAILPLGQIPQHTGRAVWDALTWEVFVPDDGEPRNFVLYEDDGESNSYLNGQWAQTSITVQRIDREVLIRLEEPRGDYAASIARRRCFARVHLEPGCVTTGVRVGGTEIVETTSVPAGGSGEPLWKRLPAEDTPERCTPLSLSEHDPGYSGSETVLVSVPAAALEIRVHFREA